MPKGEAMSQAEVERLLAVVESESGGAAAETAPAAETPEAAPSGTAQFNFPPLTVFSEAEFRVLRARHEDFIRALSGRLTAHLRLECGLQMPRLETVSFRGFRDALSNPTHLSILRLEPWNGTALLNLPPRLALALVDRELGGAGAFADEPRELTKMEARLLSPFIELVAAEWCGCWGEKLEFRPTIQRTESCPRFVHTHPADETLLLVGLDLQIGDLTEQLQLVVPLSLVEPLLAKLDTNRQPAPASPKPAPAAPARWNAALDDLPVRLTAQWHGLELTAREIGNLKPGDVVPIKSGTNEQVQILLDATPKYQGSLGTLGSNWAIKIATVLKK